MARTTPAQWPRGWAKITFMSSPDPEDLRQLDPRKAATFPTLELDRSSPSNSESTCNGLGIPAKRHYVSPVKCGQYALPVAIAAGKRHKSIGASSRIKSTTYVADRCIDCLP